MAVPARRLDELPRARPSSRRRTPAPRRRTAPARPSPARSRPQRRLPFLLFSLVVLVGMVLLLASAQALVAQGAFRASELEREANGLEEEHARLRLELAQLSSPERITRAARKAGLVLPSRIEILAVDVPDDARPGRVEPSGTLALPGAGG